MGRKNIEYENTNLGQSELLSEQILKKGRRRIIKQKEKRRSKKEKGSASFFQIPPFNCFSSAAPFPVPDQPAAGAGNVAVDLRGVGCPSRGRSHGAEGRAEEAARLPPTGSNACVDW